MWEQIGTEFILGIIGVVISGLGVFITYLINKYIKNATVRNYLNELHVIVTDVVQEVYQVYVEALKKDGAFDKAAQERAVEIALEKLDTVLSKEIKAWLDSNFADVQAFLKTLIESSIYALKSINKEK